MKAITLWPEWAWAIAALSEHSIGKRVENRSWLPNLERGERFAIHAGKSINGGRGGSKGRAAALYAVARAASSSGFGVSPTMDGYVLYPDLLTGRRVRLTENDVMATAGRIVAVVTFDGADTEQVTGWDVEGQHHWRLSDIRVVEHGPSIRGRQGLWTLPAYHETVLTWRRS